MLSAHRLGGTDQDLAQDHASFFDKEREKLRAWRYHVIPGDENEFRSSEDRPSLSFPLRTKSHDKRVVDIETIEMIAQDHHQTSAYNLRSFLQEQYGSSLKVGSGDGDEIDYSSDGVENQLSHEIGLTASSDLSADLSPTLSNPAHNNSSTFRSSLYPPPSEVHTSHPTSMGEFNAGTNTVTLNILSEAPMLSLQDIYLKDKMEMSQREKHQSS